MHGVLVRFRFLYAVFAATMGTKQFNPFKRKHVGMNIDDRHCEFLLLSVVVRCGEKYELRMGDDRNRS